MRGFWMVVGVCLVASCVPGVVPAPAVAQRRGVAAGTAEEKAPARVAALVGEPTGAELHEARLESTTCADDPATLEARVRLMRAEVNEGFQRWHDAQPACWHEYRMRAIPQDTWGTGQGFGSGHGSLGRSYRSAPRVRMGAVKMPRSASSMSSTNTQVAGVDEADIVKSDGTYVYLVANGALRIVEAMDPKVLSVTAVPGVVRELFVEGDRAVVYASSDKPPKRCTYGYDCRFAGDGTATRVLVYDVADRAAPKLARRIDLSGSLVASRRIGNAVHTVVADGDSATPSYSTWPTDLPECGTEEKVVRAKFAALKRDNEKRLRAASLTLPTMSENGVSRPLCDGLLATHIRDGHAFTTIVSFDLAADGAPAKTAMIQSRPGAVFASEDALYLSVVHQRDGGPWYSFYSSIDEASELHKFRIGSEAATTRYVGSGVVPGHVLNQFSMDEWDGKLRIATSRGRVPDPNVDSVVSILAEGTGGNLVRVGAITAIAPGEDIRAVRFDGRRGYVVTFKKTDPLFVLDLADATSPKIAGELKIPGFSTYIHRIDDDHLLSIGFDADDKGDFAFFDGVILQLFDVADAAHPKLLHKEKIGTRGSSSEAATDHLAFNYFAEKGTLAFPMTICDGGGNGRNGQDLTFSGLLVYDVSVARGFERLGGIDHGVKGADCNTWWSNAKSVVKRSLILDDLVYSIAEDRVKVQRMGHFGEDLADLVMSP
jgi:hypothetical protein